MAHRCCEGRIITTITCIVCSKVTAATTKEQGIGHSYFGQRVSLLVFHYYLHIIPESTSCFREKHGEDSSPDHVTTLTTLSPKGPEFNSNTIAMVKLFNFFHILGERVQLI